MTHHTMRGVIGLIDIMFLCLSVLPFLTTNGLAEQPADTTMSNLIDALKDPDPVIRQGVATALGGLGPKAAPAVPALIDALKKDPAPIVRQLAAFALGAIGPEANAAIPALADALMKDPDFDLDGRRQAALALGKILVKRLSAPSNLRIISSEDQSPRAVSALIDALKDQNPTIRGDAARALGTIGPEANAAIPALTDALKDPAPIVRQQAALALGAIGAQTEAAVLALTAALTDQDPNVLRSIANALERIAIVLQDAEATTMRGPLNAAYAALSTRGFDREAQSVGRAIKFLELLWWKNVTEWLWRRIHEHPWARR